MTLNEILFKNKIQLRLNLRKPFDQERKNFSRLNGGGINWLIIQTSNIAVIEELRD